MLMFEKISRFIIKHWTFFTWANGIFAVLNFFQRDYGMAIFNGFVFILMLRRNLNE